MLVPDAVPCKRVAPGTTPGTKTLGGEGAGGGGEGDIIDRAAPRRIAPLVRPCLPDAIISVRYTTVRASMEHAKDP